MTKAEELKILSDAAKKMGNDSYLGGALLELLPFVESELRSDIYPDLAGTIRLLERNLASNREDLKELEAKISAKKEELRQIEYRVFLAGNAQDRAKTDIQAAIDRLKNCL